MQEAVNPYSSSATAVGGDRQEDKRAEPLAETSNSSQSPACCCQCETCIRPETKKSSTQYNSDNFSYLGDHNYAAARPEAFSTPIKNGFTPPDLRPAWLLSGIFPISCLQRPADQSSAMKGDSVAENSLEIKEESEDYEPIDSSAANETTATSLADDVTPQDKKKFLVFSTSLKKLF